MLAREAGKRRVMVKHALQEDLKNVPQKRLRLKNASHPRHGIAERIVIAQMKHATSVPHFGILFDILPDAIGGIIGASAQAVFRLGKLDHVDESDNGRGGKAFARRAVIGERIESGDQPPAVQMLKKESLLGAPQVEKKKSVSRRIDLAPEANDKFGMISA